MPQTRPHEIAEEWMGTCGTALKFRMELRTYKPWMVCQLYDLHQTVIGRAATDDDPMCFHAPAELIVEFVTVAMTLKDSGFIIRLVGFCARSQAADPAAKAHRATFIRDIALVWH